MTNVTRIALEADSRQIRQARTDLNQMQGAAVGSQSAIAGIGKKLLALGAGVVTVQALGRAISGTISLTAEFQGVMLGLQAVSRATTEQMALMEKQARTLGATTKFSATQAGEAQRFLAMAGFSVNEVLAATPGILTLATASNMDLARAADIASNVLGGMRLEVDQLNRANDVLALTAASANTSVEQLGQALSFAAPFAEAAGISIEGASAAIGTLSDSGLQASRAGTGLVGVIRQLSRVTPEGEKVLAKYGLTVDDVNIKSHGLADVLDTVSEAQLTLSDRFQLFGSEAGAAAGILTNSSERVRELTRELREAEGAADRAADIIGSGLTAAMLGFKSAASEATLQFGEGGLIGGFSTLVETATGVITVFNGMQDELEGATQQQVELYEGIAKAAELAAVMIGGRLAVAIGARLVPALGASIASMAAATGQAYAYQTALAANTGATLAAVRAQTALTVSTGAARGTMALLGGPLGVLVAATAAAYAFREQLGLTRISLEEMENASDSAAASIANLSAMEAAHAKIEAIGRYNEAAVELERYGTQVDILSEKIRNHPRLRFDPDTLAEMDEANANLIRSQAVVAELSEEMATLDDIMSGVRPAMQGVAGDAEDLGEAAEDAAQGNDALTASMEAAAQAAQTYAQQNAEVVSALRNRLRQSEMNARQLAIDINLSKLSTTASFNERLAVIALTGALYDKEQAQRDDNEQSREAQRESERLAQANRDVTREMADDWRSLREAGGSTFADLIEDGTGAAEAIGAAWKRTFLEIVGQFATSGLAKIFGMDMPGGAGASSLFSGSGSMGKFLQSSTGQKFLQNSGLSDVIGGAGFGPDAVQAGADGSTGMPEATQGGFNSTQFIDGLKDLGANLAAGAAGSYVGGRVGERVTNKTANSDVGGMLGGAAGSLLGPWGTAIGSAVGSFLDAQFGSGTYRNMAGFLGAPTPGANKSDTFSVDAFSSGFNPTGYAQRQDQDAATAIIDVFREIDSIISGTVRELNGTVDTSRATFGGFDVNAGPGSTGTFFGGSGEDGLSTDLEHQITRYVEQLINHVDGLGEELMASIRAAQGAGEAISILAEALEEQKRTTEETARAAADAALAEEKRMRISKSAVEQAAKAVRWAQEWAQAQREAMSLATRGTDDALRQVQRATSAQRQLAQQLHEQRMNATREEFEAQRAANQAVMSAYQATIGEVGGELSGLSSAADSMRKADSAIAESLRQGALKTLSRALTGGDLTGTGAAASRAATLEADSFSSAAEFRRAQARTLFLIGSVEREAKEQLSYAELTVKRLEQQSILLEKLQRDSEDKERDRFEAQAASIDAQLQAAQEQVAASRDTSTGVTSIASALVTLSQALSEENAVSSVVAPSVAATPPPPPSEGPADYWSQKPTAQSLYTKQDIESFYAQKEAEGFTREQIVREIRDIAMAEGISSDALAGSLGWSRDELRGYMAESNVPFFKSGGNHAGGLRVVGEEGMEIESTGPSRITSNNELRDALGANAKLLNEVKKHGEFLHSTAKSSAQLRDLFERLRREGFPTIPVEDLA